ncbi:hypothetical protein [Caldivirga maquilingensis]|uniref:Uncharacterized protein n=1 Tax=Caldivirga maquilingensis (strain ATCC 700844 / DSM 13496 / JCM 10307 / IC-167) TaxID=397948 RepID=A8MAW9_CALMQ|nr:hypothetical protein [Caldivirga maquilingensis]ABW02598.1 hypothetical protein Cmaq_1775 [Caldivirga maquilingensis IC-167]
MSTLKYSAYGIAALAGYILFLASLRLTSVAAGVLFTVMFTLSQLIGLLLVSKIGAGNTLSVALSIGAIGSFIHALNNSYIGNLLLGLGMGLYFMALIGVIGIILSSSGLIDYIMYVYSGLFGVGLVIGVLSSVLNNSVLFIVVTILMLSLSFYLSLSSIYFKPRGTGLKYAVTNQVMFIVAVFISFSLPYMVSSAILLSKYWLGSAYVLSIPLSIIPTHLMVRRWGLSRSLRISIIILATSSVLTYVFNSQFTLIAVAASSMMIYSIILQLLASISSPILYMPTLAVAYGISSMLTIPIGLALGIKVGYLVVGLISLLLMLLLRMIKEPVYQFPKAN